MNLTEAQQKLVTKYGTPEQLRAALDKFARPLGATEQQAEAVVREYKKELDAAGHLIAYPTNEEVAVLNTMGDNGWAVAIISPAQLQGVSNAAMAHEMRLQGEKFLLQELQKRNLVAESKCQPLTCCYAAVSYDREDKVNSNTCWASVRWSSCTVLSRDQLLEALSCALRELVESKDGSNSFWDELYDRHTAAQQPFTSWHLVHVRDDHLQPLRDRLKRRDVFDFRITWQTETGAGHQVSGLTSSDILLYVPKR